MPTYDYECDKCPATREEFFTVALKRETLKCSCGGKMHSIISCLSDPQCFDYYDEALEERVTGPEHRRKIMKEKQISEY